MNDWAGLGSSLAAANVPEDRAIDADGPGTIGLDWLTNLRTAFGLTLERQACTTASSRRIRSGVFLLWVADSTRRCNELVEHRRMGAVIADKGYDSDAFVNTIRAARSKAVIAGRTRCDRTGGELVTYTHARRPSIRSIPEMHYCEIRLPVKTTGANDFVKNRQFPSDHENA
ncbi:hypothetical protein [Burkholderia sp. SIMBA_062]|uniref:hypothetical protein n=1 Tax=Burkholderia sp. SIMBA_062 TaxID=3085803 RepID=UPI00397BA2B8